MPKSPFELLQSRSKKALTLIPKLSGKWGGSDGRPTCNAPPAGAAKALPKIDIKKIDVSPSLLCSSRGQAAAIRPLKATV